MFLKSPWDNGVLRIGDSYTEILKLISHDLGNLVHSSGQSVQLLLLYPGVS